MARNCFWLTPHVICIRIKKNVQLIARIGTNRIFETPWSSKSPTHNINWCSHRCQNNHHKHKQIVSTLTVELQRPLKVKVGEVALLLRHLYGHIIEFVSENQSLL